MIPQRTPTTDATGAQCPPVDSARALLAAARACATQLLAAIGNAPEGADIEVLRALDAARAIEIDYFVRWHMSSWPRRRAMSAMPPVECPGGPVETDDDEPWRDNSHAEDWRGMP